MLLQPLEDGVRNWIKLVTGFTDGQIFFGNQNGPQPNLMPFITITVHTEMRAIGALDEINYTTDLTQIGREMIRTAYGQRDVLVTLQAFAENAVSLGGLALPHALPGTNGITAVELLSGIQMSLNREDVRANLNAAGLSPYDKGVVRRVDAVIETVFEGRAVLDLRMYAVDTVTEQTGYIKEVIATGTFTDGNQTRTATLDVIGT